MDKVRNYETAIVLRPDLDDDKREEIIERIKSVITDNNGEINNIDEWGNRQLAYEIEDYRTGYYTFINFNSSPDILDKLEHNYRILGEIIRSLIVRKDD
ncbi:MAG TPA: 30S ribosomal protein S6 [Halanaerobiales bacterium]|nr:30S ribosomal protein S6 [Halanaerobiales bacterium]